MGWFSPADESLLSPLPSWEFNPLAFLLAWTGISGGNIHNNKKGIGSR
jgi:hypothetical protein